MNTSSNSTSFHEFWIEFIELYKSKPVLWKYGTEIYKDRKGKKLAYLELVEKMREVEPNATVDMVKKKINSLRSCYRRKWYKAQEDLKLGIDADVKWVYYKHFNFLRECKDTEEDEEDSWSQCEDSSFVRLDNSEPQSDADENDYIVEYAPQKMNSKGTYYSPNLSKSSNELKDVPYTGLNKSNEEDGIMDMALKISAQHKFWIAFINLYRSKPELWKHGSEVYKDRDAKKVAYLDLVEKMREVEPNADVDMVKRKINSLRSIYRRKWHKMKRAISLGKTPEVKWVYFDHFSFLHECKDPLDNNGSWNHCDDSINTKFNYNCTDTEQKDIDEIEVIEEVSLLNDSKKAECELPSPSPKRIRNEATDVSFKKLKDSNDEADILGISWAYQYRSLTETQKLFAKKAIDDILFEARLETLHRNSVKINTPRCDKCNN
ncbi:PREDICTED: uncharacterized protein LOC108361317 [Rhagoletis zephyria]|uniref:uncharacterized protein LOC108361317 n=1 Tax=Rhagoletis zephyria TaxID=28612 RepID=UPI0008114905|nr:PREDICTED: uncharacterized protein LOC108361317 [Rhagoletis zephyria]